MNKIYLIILITLLGYDRSNDLSKHEIFASYIGHPVKLSEQAYLIKCPEENRYFQFTPYILRRSPIKDCHEIRLLPVGTELRILQVLSFDKVAVGKTLYAFGTIDSISSDGPIYFEYSWSFYPDGLSRAVWDNDSIPERRPIVLD